MNKIITIGAAGIMSVGVMVSVASPAFASPARCTAAGATPAVTNSVMCNIGATSGHVSGGTAYQTNITPNEITVYVSEKDPDTGKTVLKPEVRNLPHAPQLDTRR